ncbi:MAG: phosphotransferase family protein [Alphaproteobacteria bacterium]|nr:phosphotransferase family protein [Alphaproteobacteria bacterium]
MTDPGAAAALERVRQLPLWRGPIEAEPLQGGLSNRNFRVRDGADLYVVRLVDGDVPEHGIVREREIQVTRAAHRAGIAPELVFADHHTLVLRFIEGRTLTPEEIRTPAMIERITGLMRQCHDKVAQHLRGPAPFFHVFHALRDYLARQSEHGAAPARIERLRGIVAELAREAGPVDLALTHNDLMPGNFIDDGARLWLIDWEYGGYGAPLFDLATLVVNNALDAAMQSHVLASYYRRKPPCELERRFTAMVLAATLRESLWGRIQEGHGRLAFDYRGYADDYEAKFERGWAEFRSAPHR